MSTSTGEVTGAHDVVLSSLPALRREVLETGSALVRGLDPMSTTEFADVVTIVAGAPATDKEPFAPRRRHHDGVYSATRWPSTQPMCMHHESSYTLDLPTLLMFSCTTAPRTGGATGLADGAAVLRSLPTDLVDRVSREGWILQRAYTGEIGASIADVFGTDDRTSIEKYCRANAIDASWQSGTLHTRQRRSAVVEHPATGVLCWFNQIAFLSEWTMDADVRDFVRDAHGSDSLPFTTLYGNGDAIEEDVIATIGGVYDEHTRREDWRAGDLLLVDNVRTAHSREQFTGDRDIVVGMGAPRRHVGTGATA